MGDPVFLRSQIANPAYYQKHESAILRALRDGRVVDDVAARKPPPKATVNTAAGHGKSVWIDTAGPKVEPPATETAPTKPPGQASGSDFSSTP
jgi:hypothetical protein